MAKEPGCEAVCPLEEVPDTGFIVRPWGDTEVAICRTADTIHVVENRCSHAFSPFDGGRLRGHRLMCPLHGACFDVRTGEPLGRPAVRPIRVFEVRLVNGDVHIAAGD